MSMIIRKKQLVSAALILAVGAAVFANWYYQKNVTKTAQAPYSVESQSDRDVNLGDSLFVQGKADVTEADTETAVQTAASVSEYFANARLSREKSHGEVTDELQKLSQQQDTDVQTKNKCERLLNEFTQNVKLESDVENLIYAKTSSQCLVSINNGKADVVVEPGILDANVSLQITEILQRQAEISSDNISIIETK